MSGGYNISKMFLPLRKHLSQSFPGISSASRKQRRSTATSSTASESDLSPTTQSIYRGLIGGERQALARAITLVESTHPNHMAQSAKLLSLVEAKSASDSDTFRIGISGPPGAGKSTFIERFGSQLTAEDHKVAVLAVDPSSGTTGGSLLGDKTRMPELTRNPRAYIRPSPSGGHLGGVTRRTNEAVVLCEAAGFDIVIVETVGVGQSEYLVADMVDMFCLVIPPAGGDELQGIKRGIVEQSDLVVVNKCDGDLAPAARRIKSEYTSALKYMRRKSHLWKPKVKMMSSLTGDGMGDVWDAMQKYNSVMAESGHKLEKRAIQRQKWMWAYINSRLLEVSESHSFLERLKEIGNCNMRSTFVHRSSPRTHRSKPGVET